MCYYDKKYANIGGEKMGVAGDIFREVAQAAGDIVFRYDLVTGKFMQYSDRSELSKYGAWLSDFDSSMINAKMIYPDDVPEFQKLADKIKSGDTGTIEGFFRMRLHISADYRWYRLLARTKFEQGKPIEVLGRVADVHNYMTSRNEQAVGATGHIMNMMGLSDVKEVREVFRRYVEKHKSDAMIACIIYDVSEYDNVVRGMSRSKEEEFLINLIRRIRRCYPHGTLVCRTGHGRFAIFSGAIGIVAELGDAVAKSVQELEELGMQHAEKLKDGRLGVSVGVNYEKNISGMGQEIYDRAEQALERALDDEENRVVFYKGDDETTSEEACSRQEDSIAENIISMLESMGESESDEEVKKHALECINRLLEAVGVRYGFERVTFSVRGGEEYAELGAWGSDAVKNIPDGCLLHVSGNADDVEEKVTFWEPYVVNDVNSYPDSSAYGRMVGLSSVRSFAQSGFECNDGRRYIVSLEYYTQAHLWSAEELNAFNTIKYAADFCMKYM